MKFEYVFMGYVIIVIARFYCCVIHDEFRKWRETSAAKNQIASQVIHYHR